MNKTIKLRPIILTKSLWIVSLFGIIVSVLLYLLLDINLSYIYALCMVVVFSGIITAFYINRNEIEILEANEGTFKLHYINKAFFKRVQQSGVLREIVIVLRGEILLLKKDDKTIAILRKNSTTNEEWIFILKYFNAHID